MRVVLIHGVQQVRRELDGGRRDGLSGSLCGGAGVVERAGILRWVVTTDVRRGFDAGVAGAVFVRGGERGDEVGVVGLVVDACGRWGSGESAASLVGEGEEVVAGFVSLVRDVGLEGRGEK